MTPQPAERFSFQQALHGAGGFAKIIRGKDNVLDREIAVKVLDPLLGSEFSEADRERFRREARILAKLSHPNIPAIYDVNFGEGHLWIIFQFIEGKNLREIMAESGSIPIATARIWFQQIASALDHAHRLGIVHRDIKPENIIVTPDGNSAYLVDFGIALSAEEGKRLTKSGYVIGTPGYMSPEQQAGDPVDGSSDIYSLAITLYESLAGKPIRQALYEPLSTINEAIPPQVDDLVLACLEDKGRRLDSAKLFSSQLAGALQLPSKPFSEVLSHGRLHELALSLESLTASDIVRLPMGQRDLLTSKINDLVTSNEPSLQYPSERFLELMLTRGVFLPKEDYRDIVTPAIEWAFERTFDHRLGKNTIREALEVAGFTARAEAHQVLLEEFTAFLNRARLDDKEDWYLHAIREVIVALMANPACTEGAGALKTSLRNVNRIQRSRTEVS
ncbi:MAG TPA: serine/threonine-protein kinase [Bryobacteraceae bacterium]|nr:serine/threonine-protein kinase [Bryobacteraceae bacterium]